MTCHSCDYASNIQCVNVMYSYSLIRGNTTCIYIYFNKTTTVISSIILCINQSLFNSTVGKTHIHTPDDSAMVASQGIPIINNLFLL